MTITKITSKFQTTIPTEVRKVLGVSAGKEVEWYIVKGMIVVDSAKTTQHPVKFLTSQIKISLDAVKLVHQARGDFS